MNDLSAWRRHWGKTDAKESMDFIAALVELQEQCGVADLKMSDYGIKPDEFMTLAQYMSNYGRIVLLRRVLLSDEECAAIF